MWEGITQTGRDSDKSVCRKNGKVMQIKGGRRKEKQQHAADGVVVSGTISKPHWQVISRQTNLFMSFCTKRMLQKMIRQNLENVKGGTTKQVHTLQKDVPSF